MKIIVGSRGSSLALKQTEYVIEKLQRAYPENEYEIKVTFIPLVIKCNILLWTK